MNEIDKVTHYIQDKLFLHSSNYENIYFYIENVS